MVVFAADYIIEITPDHPDAQTQSMLCPEAQKTCFLALKVGDDTLSPYVVDVEVRFVRGSILLFFMYKRDYLATSSGGRGYAEIVLDQEGRGHEAVTLYRPHPLSRDDAQHGPAVMRYSHDALMRLGVVIRPQ